MLILQNKVQFLNTRCNKRYGFIGNVNDYADYTKSSYSVTIVIE